MSKSLQCKRSVVFSRVSRWVVCLSSDAIKTREDSHVLDSAVCMSALKTGWTLCFALLRLWIVPLPVFTQAHSQVHFLFSDLRLPLSSLYCTGLKKPQPQPLNFGRKQDDRRPRANTWSEVRESETQTHKKEPEMGIVSFKCRLWSFS